MIERILRILTIASLTSMIAATAASAQNRQDSSMVRFGLTTSLVEADVNTSDVMAAAKVWAITMGKGVGIWTTADASIYSTASELQTATNKGELDLAALGTHEYLEVQDSIKAVPVLTYMIAGNVENQYLVLVHRDSPYKSIKDLHNQRITWTRSGRNTLIPAWLDVLLNENGIRESRTFFREVKNVSKASQAILPVFFRQIESGIVLKSSFDTAVQLNPQIGQQLRVLAASPKLVMMVLCMRTGLAQEKKEQYVRAALRLHETPVGLQSLSFFKLDRLVSWNPAYLDNVRDLMGRMRGFRSGAELQVRSTPFQAGKGK